MSFTKKCIFCLLGALVAPAVYMSFFVTQLYVPRHECIRTFVLSKIRGGGLVTRLVSVHIYIWFGRIVCRWVNMWPSISVPLMMGVELVDVLRSRPKVKDSIMSRGVRLSFGDTFVVTGPTWKHVWFTGVYHENIPGSVIISALTR